MKREDNLVLWKGKLTIKGFDLSVSGFFIMSIVMVISKLVSTCCDVSWLSSLVLPIQVLVAEPAGCGFESKS